MDLLLSYRFFQNPTLFFYIRTILQGWNSSKYANNLRKFWGWNCTEYELFFRILAIWFGKSYAKKCNAEIFIVQVCQEFQSKKYTVFPHQFFHNYSYLRICLGVAQFTISHFYWRIRGLVRIFQNFKKFNTPAENTKKI